MYFQCFGIIVHTSIHITHVVEGIGLAKIVVMFFKRFEGLVEVKKTFVKL